MNEHGPAHRVMQRGRLLREQGRHAEAEKFFLDVLQQSPDDVEALCELALCRGQIDGRKEESIHAIDRAVSLEPESSHVHALRALLLHDISRYGEALASAERAVALAAENAMAHFARSAALAGLNRWADAEVSVRQALSLDPDYAAAHNLLSHILRIQGKMDENADQIRTMLSRNPESADTHVSAGWSALRRGERDMAEGHFLEALRLEADNDFARRGLLEAYKSRSPMYRLYLRYCFFMQQFTPRQQWSIAIGIYIGYRVLVRAASGYNRAVAAGIVIAYLLFVFWGHLARSVGNFIIALDRKARHALVRREQRDAGVGGLVLVGVVALALGSLGGFHALAIIGYTALGMSLPLAHTFMNRSRQGRGVFGLIATMAFVAGVMNLIGLARGDVAATSSALTGLAIVAVVISTWLPGIGALKR